EETPAPKKEKKAKKAKKAQKEESEEEKEEKEEKEEEEEEDEEEKDDLKRKRDDENEVEEEEESSPKVAKTDASEAQPIVYATRLSFEAKEETLREHFKNVGEIKTLEWINDQSDTFCGGAVLTFEDVETATKATELDRTELDGRTISVEIHKPFTAGCKTLFIGGLNKNTLDEENFKQFLTDN
ncbi:RNA recognition motif domain-containing protein, partial [Escherichia coli]|uniref:RNA recognition motif domain-containing protein n=1 Tax=Escherichia coli TaxID=562 RepID=UPI000B91D1A0